MKKMTDQQTEQFRKLNAPNTYPGLFGLISILGALLSLIGAACPFFSYNPTNIDDLKRTVSLFELSSSALAVALIGLLLLVVAILIRGPQTSMLMKYVQDPEKRPIGKRLMTASVLIVVLALLSLLLVQISSVFYVIPESDFLWLQLESDAGSILYYIGIFLFAAFNLASCFLWKRCTDGTVTLEALTFAGRKAGAEKAGEESLPAQLATWKKLLDDGTITQEEYDRKKEELLRKS